jgi:surfeit locus 1 family protein
LALRFVFRWYSLLLLGLAVPLFVVLGFWQWHRGEYRSAVWADFERADIAAIETNAAVLQSLPRFTRVSVRGEFDAARQVLLDNISHQGKPGYQVLSLLRLADGTGLVVNRGWVPFSGYRERLPDVGLAAHGEQHISGRLAVLPVAGIASGRAPPALEGAWPRVSSFPTFAELQRLWGVALAPSVLLLDEDAGPGYLRDWRPPGISPDRNYSYAIQWWSFALLAIAMFVGLNLKRKP